MTSCCDYTCKESKYEENLLLSTQPADQVWLENREFNDDLIVAVPSQHSTIMSPAKKWPNYAEALLDLLIIHCSGNVIKGGRKDDLGKC